jgi:hypothetical protein
MYHGSISAISMINVFLIFNIINKDFNVYRIYLTLLLSITVHKIIYASWYSYRFYKHKHFYLVLHPRQVC